jgi:hypothetical protein
MTEVKMRRKPILISLLVLTGFISLILVMGGTRLLAEATAVNAGAPALISYQGFVTDSSDEPLADGSYTMKFALYTAESGGTKIWEETQNSVSVSNGFFSVLLGNGNCTTGCPLDAGDFSDPARYLQSSIDSGSGFVDFPRQQLASAPYSLQAEAAVQAETAASAPWSGLTGVPAGFADGTDDGSQYANVINVAKSGGDYASVANALDSISDAAADNPYLVAVAAGVYTETNLVSVPAYVHLRGSGQNATKIVSTRSASGQTPDSATVDLADNGRISHATIANSGTSSTYAIAIYSALATRAAVVDHVTAIVDGNGGNAHYAVYLNDAEPVIQNSELMASVAQSSTPPWAASTSPVASPRPLI